jgi:hypothetical protein
MIGFGEAEGEAEMNIRVGAIVLALAWMLAFTSRGEAAALSLPVSARSSQTSDFSARRAHHRHRYDDRIYRPSYYGRPTYYAPAPFGLFPPFFGYGWEPW